MMARSKVLDGGRKEGVLRYFIGDLVLFHDEIPKNAVAKFYFEKKAPNVVVVVVVVVVRQLTPCVLRCRRPDSFFIELILHFFIVLGQLALPRRRPFVAIPILAV